MNDGEMTPYTQFIGDCGSVEVINDSNKLPIICILQLLGVDLRRPSPGFVNSDTC